VTGVQTCALPIWLAPIAAIYAQDVESIAQKWAEIKYQQPDKAVQIKLLDDLATEVARLAADKGEKDGVEYRVWQGAILSTKASMVGGLSALGDVRKARDVLEAALKKDPAAGNGYGAAVLAALYGKVPGWPIAFGDEDKAQALFNRALKVAPDDIDVNYLYGAFLVDERRYKEAEAVLKKAMAAPPRAQRVLADKGRRAEIEQALERVSKANQPQRVGPQP